LKICIYELSEGMMEMKKVGSTWWFNDWVPTFEIWLLFDGNSFFSFIEDWKWM